MTNCLRLLIRLRIGRLTSCIRHATLIAVVARPMSWGRMLSERAKAVKATELADQMASKTIRT